MENKKIIAVVGMAGSGKSEVVKFLQSKYRWPKVYFGEATFTRLKEEGLELNYKNEQIIREKIRSELGMGAYAILAKPKIDQALKTNDTVVIESLYSWEEYRALKTAYGNYFKVLAVFASPATRLKRLLARSGERPISSRQEFEERDLAEIEGTNKGGPIACADFMFINESSISDLHFQITNTIRSLNFGEEYKT